MKLASDEIGFESRSGPFSPSVALCFTFKWPNEIIQQYNITGAYYKDWLALSEGVQEDFCPGYDPRTHLSGKGKQDRENALKKPCLKKVLFKTQGGIFRSRLYKDPQTKEVGFYPEVLGRHQITSRFNQIWISGWSPGGSTGGIGRGEKQKSGRWFTGLLCSKQRWEPKLSGSRDGDGLRPEHVRQIQGMAWRPSDTRVVRDEKSLGRCLLSDKGDCKDGGIQKPWLLQSGRSLENAGNMPRVKARGLG